MKYYLVDDDPDIRFDDVDDLIDYCVSVDYFEEDTDAFDEYLDQDGSIYIAGNSYSPSELLYAIDEDSYLQAKRDWAESCADSERDNAAYDANYMSPGRSFYICNYEIFVYEETDEDDEEEEPASVDERISILQKLTEQIEEKEKLESQKKEADFESLFQHF